MARHTTVQLALKFLAYRMQRRNYKYIHSPFVHELVNAVLATHKEPTEWPAIKNIVNAKE